MAPEQILHESVDERADLAALTGRLAGLTGVAEVAPPQLSADRDTALEAPVSKRTASFSIFATRAASSSPAAEEELVRRRRHRAAVARVEIEEAVAPPTSPVRKFTLIGGLLVSAIGVAMVLDLLRLLPRYFQFLTAI